MSSNLITNIQNCIQSSTQFGFYYTFHPENVDENNKVLVCYPLFINIEDNTLIAIFSNDDIQNVKHLISKDTFATSFNPNEELESTRLYSFKIEDIIEFTDYSDDAWDKYSSCEGCRYAISNQQGHYGGCIDEY